MMVIFVHWVTNSVLCDSLTRNMMDVATREVRPRVSHPSSVKESLCQRCVKHHCAELPEKPSYKVLHHVHLLPRCTLIVGQSEQAARRRLACVRDFKATARALPISRLAQAQGNQEPIKGRQDEKSDCVHHHVSTKALLHDDDKRCRQQRQAANSRPRVHTCARMPGGDDCPRHVTERASQGCRQGVQRQSALTLEDGGTGRFGLLS